MTAKENKTLEGSAGIKNGVKRAAFAGLSILLELIFVLVLALRFNNYAQWISIATRTLALLLVLAIYSQHRTSSIKMFWIIMILLAPVLGVTMYLLIGMNGSTHSMRERYARVDSQLLPLLTKKDTAEGAETRAAIGMKPFSWDIIPRDLTSGETDIQKRLRDRAPSFANIAVYLERYTGYPVCDDTAVTYYSDAADGLEAQITDLRKAKSFIFMEYHAIEEAKAFGRILEVLKQKVKEGVEVRLFYDDIGSIGFINTDFVERMTSFGIQCRVFNPVGPWLKLFLNNRDHRKITVIDGLVGFTGGYNLADEYFHLKEAYGYWKDTGLRLEGSAVNNLTVTFLEMWNAVNKDDADDVDFSRYISTAASRAAAGAASSAAGPSGAPASRGMAQPYADSPMDNEHVGENVYISIAESAKHYAWFMTPYLIITDEMCYALGMAAKRGVDVRIITPGIPDKKTIYQLTRSFYNGLVRNGVRIYEYTPGFCHAKMCVADDVTATCGTINLDYRSLYHHFENGCILYDDPAVIEIRKDFEETFPQCRDVTEQYLTGRSQILRFGQLLLRLFAPLL